MTVSDPRTLMVRDFGDASVERLDRFELLLRKEAECQNLIARSTIPAIWSRHFIDSAQLLPYGAADGPWIDIGSGAGLPGIVIACCSDLPVVLVEPRALRVAFLNRCIAELGLRNAHVIHAKSQNVTLPQSAATISARAVATISALFDGCCHLADNRTRWVLPKGTRAQSEVAIARQSWHGTFHVKRSMVDPTSDIVVATGVRRR